MVYDYAIIGAGAAGLQLALGMAKDDFFNDKTILILDPDTKETNDRTWSYWEKGIGNYDDIITAKWSTTKFYGNGQELTLDLGRYNYKTLKGLDFYTHAKSILGPLENFHWIQDSIRALNEGETVTISGDQEYFAKYVFDSRIPISNDEIQKSTGVLQHFIGWEIETKESHFDVSSFTMMDYRLKWKDTTSFMYVLPFTKNKALVEFTFFSPELVKNEVYEQMLKKYIADILKIEDYKITSTEQGIIPMFDYPFHKHNTEKITKIGTAGGWVKPSSGYSFSNSGKKCDLVINNIKNGKAFASGLFNKKYALYDSTFLSVLQNENHLGEDLFTIMYGKNKIETVLSFLDEETSFGQEIGLMNTFPKAKFGMAMISSITR